MSEGFKISPVAGSIPYDNTDSALTATTLQEAIDEIKVDLIDFLESEKVSGPGTPSSTDNAIVRWDGTSGRLIQDSSSTISDSGALVFSESSGSVPALSITSSNYTPGDPDPFAIVEITGTAITSAAGSEAVGQRITFTDASGDDGFHIIGQKINVVGGGSSADNIGIDVTVTGAGTPLAASFNSGAIHVGDLTASRALTTNSSKNLASSSTTDTELGYVSGVTSAIQTQLNNKQPLDATLTALAAYSTVGVVVMTASDVFAGRSLSAPAAGLTITNPSGTAGDPTFALANDLSALEGLASTGFAVRSATDTWVQRSLTAPAAGLTIANNDGVSGNPTFALANDLSALEGLSSTGIAIRSATDTWVQRTITGTSNRLTVTNGDGVSGNPTLDIAATYVGQTSITTLGTITTGTWTGTTIAVLNGGTGQTTYTNGQLLIGNTTGNTLTKATLTAGTNISITNGTGSITVATTGVALSSEPYVTIGNTSGLSAERALTGTSNQITITDNGANSTVVLSTPQDIATTSNVIWNRSTHNQTNVISSTDGVVLANTTASTLNTQQMSPRVRYSGSGFATAAGGTLNSGVQYPTTITDSGGGDSGWTNQNNIKVSDGVFATVVLNIFDPINSNTLYCTLGTSVVPANANILGVMVEVNRKSSSSSAHSDLTVQLVIDSVASGTNKASGTFYTTSAVTATYGDSSDLWGNSISATQVNSGNFGVAFAAFATGSGTVSVDYVRVTVYYSAGAASAVDWVEELLPVQGTSAPTSELDFKSQIASGGYTKQFNLTTTGYANARVGFQINGSTALAVMTAKSFIYTDASGLLAATTAPTNGKILIGSTGNIPVSATITGTSNQVVVTNGAGSITLSTPQSIGTASNVQFAKLSLGTNDTTNIVNLDGQSAQTIWSLRNTTSNTAGLSLTVQSGGATSAATDKAAGDLILRPGISTGTGLGAVVIKGLTRAASTGTSDNSITDRVIVGPPVTLTDAATSLFDVALGASAMCGGLVLWTIEAGDGTNFQALSGMTSFSAVNKAGVYTTAITNATGNDAKSVSSGTLTTTWTVVSGTNKVTIKVTPSGSLTETTYRITFTVFNNSGNAVTLI